MYRRSNRRPITCSLSWAPTWPNVLGLRLAERLSTLASSPVDCSSPTGTRRDHIPLGILVKIGYIYDDDDDDDDELYRLIGLLNWTADVLPCCLVQLRLDKIGLDDMRSSVSAM